MEASIMNSLGHLMNWRNAQGGEGNYFGFECWRSELRWW